MRNFIDIVSGSTPISPTPSTGTVLSLLEAAKAYEQMMDSTITFLSKLSEVCEYDSAMFLELAQRIRTEAKKLGNGRNLATWFTRWARAALVSSLNNFFIARQRDSSSFGKGDFASPEILATIARYTNKVVQDYERQSKGPLLKTQQYMDFDRSLMLLVGKLEHFKTVDFDPIQTYTYIDQTPDQVIEELERQEQRFTERKNTQRHLSPKAEDKIVLQLDDDFAWFQLPRKSCFDEKNAMAHCGNTASPREGQTILSLREHVTGDKWIPHATFILNPDGTLGERKGYANHKLKPAFFKYVIPLLKQPWIKGLVGGAHASQNDFAMSWLPEGQREELYQANPNLFNIEYRYNKDGLTPEIAHIIANGVQKLGEDWYRLNDFTLAKMTDEDRNKLFDEYPVLMGLKDQYDKFGMTKELADFIGDGVARESERFYYKNKFSINDLPEEDRYKLWDFRPELMSLENRLQRFGMNDDTMTAIMAKLTGGGDPEATRRFINGLSEANKNILYAAHPEAMRPAVYYHRLGLTDQLKEIAINGIRHGGLRWCKQNQFFPNFPSSSFDHYELVVAQGNTVSGEPAGCVLTPEESADLFDGHEALLKTIFPHGYYDKHGMTDELADQINQTAMNRGYHVANTELPFNKLHPEDHDALLDKHPSLHTVKDYYRRNGLDQSLEEYLVSMEVETNYDAANHIPDGHNWTKTDNRFDIRTDLSDEDRERMFRDHPEVMTFPEHYERRGMDAAFLKDLKKGWDEEGKKFIKGNDIDLDEFLSPEDRAKLFKSKPQYFKFEDQVKAMKPAKFFESVEAENEHLQDAPWPYNHRMKLSDDKKDIIVAEYSDMDDLISELGDSNLQHYGSSDFSYDGWDDGDDVSQMENVIPHIVKQKICEYAQATYGKTPSDDADDDEDENYDDDDSDDIDWNDWDEVIEVLNDNGDGVYQGLQNAVSEGMRSGYESEVFNAVSNAVENIDTEMGHFIYQTHVYNGEENKTRDGPIYFALTLEEMATFLDKYVNADYYCDYTVMKNFIKGDEISFRERDFYGFDDDAALDRFMGELDSDILEGVPQNPYRPLVHGRREWLKVPRKKMIAEINELYAKAPERRFARWTPTRKWNGLANNGRGAYENAGATTIEELDDETLTKVFRQAVDQFYI